jgi:hypothetical protein
MSVETPEELRREQIIAQNRRRESAKAKGRSMV